MKFLLFLPVLLFASPQGEKVQHGDPSFSRNQKVLQITHHEKHAIIHWDSFNIAKGEKVHFSQNKDAAILNRVFSQNGTQIFGEITGEGRVFLIDEKGILIGKEGRISLGSFLGASMHLEDKNFFEGGPLLFTGKNGAKILNEGLIEGTSVFLIGNVLKNTGEMRGDSAALLEGEYQVLLTENPDGRFFVRLSHNGPIEPFPDIFSEAINCENVVDCTGFSQTGDEIFLQ